MKIEVIETKYPRKIGDIVTRHKTKIMKIEIDFGEQKKNLSINDLTEAIIRFLERNGIYKGSFNTGGVTVKAAGNRKVCLRLCCANINYSKSLALLQLVCSIEKSPLYIEYRLDNIYVCMYSDESSRCIDYLDNCDITIN